MKSLLVTSLVLLSAIILVGCGKQPTDQVSPNAKNSAAQQSVQSVAPPAIIDKNIQWEKYSDNEHGFEFEYVKNDDSFVSSDGRQTGLIFSVKKDGLEAMYGEFKNRSKSNPADCQKGFKNVGSIIIGGIAANKCVNPADTAGPAWTAIIQKKVSGGVDAYAISCSNERSDSQSYCEKILSTFKFTE